MNWSKDIDQGVVNEERPVRLAIVVSHPIQHFVHFYRCLALEKRVCLRVIFCSDIGVRSYFDKDMATHIAWSCDLLSGYDHVFLPEAARINDTRFFSVNNSSITTALQSFSPDVVLVHGYAQLTMIRAMLWCRASGIPTMMISDSELLHERPWHRRCAKAVILPKLLAQHNAFLTTGDNNEEYLGHYGVPQNKMFRSPFTIDEYTLSRARVQKMASRETFCEAHRLPKNILIYVFVGKLIARKKPGDIIESFSILNRSLPFDVNVCAVFAGDGSLRRSLEERAQSLGVPCRFLGFVNVNLLPDVYAASDVLVHPSEVDAQPLSTCEAAFVGLPLIVSDRVGAVGPTDTARAGENAIVYPCGDIAALAAAMLRLAEDTDLRRRMGEASLRISAELDVRRSVRGVLEAVSFVTGRNVAPN